MSFHRLALATVVSLCLGCQSTGTGAPASLCDTPGRQALADTIVARGGQLVPDAAPWDSSIEADAKARMGPPLAKVVLPQDKFNAQDVASAQAAFPEAQITAPLSLDNVEEDDANEAAED